MSPPVTSAVLRPGLSVGVLAPVAGLVTASVLALLGGPDAPLEAVRAGAAAWLVALGAGLEGGGVDVGLVPHGGLLLCGVLTVLVTRRVVPEGVAAPGAFAAVAAGAAGLVAAVVATLVSTGPLAVAPPRAALAGFVVHGVGALLGATVPHGRLGDLLPADRPAVAAVLRAAVAGVVVLLGAAAGVVAVRLVLTLDRAAQLWAMLDPGLLGGVVLAVLCLLALPTVVLWAGAVLLGPGLALGAQTSLDLSGAQLAQVPAFPVLAALPAPGSFPGWVVLLGLVPLVAGAVAGWRVRPPGGFEAVAARVGLGAAAGAVAGAVCGVLVGSSGGSLGPGRLAEVGPSLGWPLVVAVPTLALGGALGAAVAHYRDHRGEPGADDAGRDASDRPPRRPRLRIGHQSPGADRRDG